MRYRLWGLFFGTVVVAAWTTTAAQDTPLFDGKPVSVWLEALKLGLIRGESNAAIEKIERSP